MATYAYKGPYKTTIPRVVFTSNAGKLGVRWRARARALDEELYNSQKQIADKMLKEARRLSSFRMYRIGKDPGYPYAVNRKPGYPPVPGPPEYINIQSGKFVKAWSARITKTPTGITTTVYNRMPYSRYMVGTSKMIPRPIADAIAKFGRTKMKGEVEEAFQRTVRKTGGVLNDPPPTFGASLMRGISSFFGGFFGGKSLFG